MSDKKDSKKTAEKTSEKSGRSTQDTARKIWLAGIGAYGRAFTEAQEAVKSVTGGTSKVFDELVQKGEMIEHAVDAKRKEMMDKAHVPDLGLDERIKKMRSRLARSAEPSDAGESVNERLDRMEAKIDEIHRLLKKPARSSKSSTSTAKKK